MKIEDIPEYEITIAMYEKLKKIDVLLGSAKQIGDRKAILRLRKDTKARSINSSLAIEGNELGLLSVRDIVNGKTVEGPFDEILEIKNANNAYSLLDTLNPWSVDDFLKAQDTMMFGLVESEGFRTSGIGIFEGDRMIYRAPDHTDVRPMVNRLLEWGKRSGSHPFIKASIVHFYIESIHPFEDGNGRMGRLWQTLILKRYDKVFSMIPIESGIKKNQSKYYEMFEKCQLSEPHDCTAFIDFMMDVAIESLENLLHLLDPDMVRLLDALGEKTMSSREIMERMSLKDRANFAKKYLHPAIDYGMIEMTGPRNSPVQKYRRLID